MRVKPLGAALVAVAVCSCGGGGGGDAGGGGPCDVFVEARCIDAARMEADVAALASGAFAGRLAGTPGNDAVVALAAERFAASLERPPGRADHLQPFPFGHWEPEAAQLTLAGAAVPLGSGYEILYDAASGSAGPAELVFVGYGLRVPPYEPAAYPDCPFPSTGYDDYAGVDLTGKIAVALRYYPANDGTIVLCPPDPDHCTTGSARCYQRLSYKARTAAAAGAAGLLLVTPSWAGPSAPEPFFGIGFEVLPALWVDRARLQAVVPGLQTWAASIDASFSPSSHATGVTASMEVRGAFHQLQAANVVGIVPGTDPVLKDEHVVIGAHLDHMGRLPLRTQYFPGADDNASGTAAVLELARAVGASATRPRRTLIFALWNAEELGLVGSCHYAEVEPLLPLASTVAAFSVDMVGAGEPGLELWGGEEAPWMPALAEAGATALRLPWTVYARPDLFASDHACFGALGIPAFLASTPEILSHPTYHTVNDVAAGVSRRNLESATKLLWAGVRELAMGAELPAPAAASPAAPAARKAARQDALRESPRRPGFLRD